MNLAPTVSDVFNEEIYLRSNPDVREAIRHGTIVSGLEHCLAHGLDERRAGIPAAMLDLHTRTLWERAHPGLFDEEKYLQANPDVRAAIREGTILSGLEHCLVHGVSEDRPGISVAMRELQKKLLWERSHPCLFGEETYLEANPDVRAAIRQGAILSGLEHCLTYGLDECRGGIPAAMQETHARMLRDSSELPLPPEALRRRVHGGEDAEEFDYVGRVVAANIGCVAQGLFEGGKVFDFGCGSGRVIRHLRRLWPRSRFFGSDIDRSAIEWCDQHLGSEAQFAPNEATPPLPFDDGSFDLAYAVSVFTHLPEDMQFAWLEELRRVMRPGGVLLISIHGGELLPTDATEAHRHFLSHGFYYSFDGGTDGLPSFYGTAYHKRDYVLRRWGDYFDIPTIVRRGLAKHQDLVVCRRRG